MVRDSNENQAALNQRVKRPYSAAPPAFSCDKESDIPAFAAEFGGGTDKMEEPKGYDDLTEENRNAKEVRNEYNWSQGSFPPASVAPVAESAWFDSTGTSSSTATSENSGMFGFLGWLISVVHRFFGGELCKKFKDVFPYNGIFRTFHCDSSSILPIL